MSSEKDTLDFIIVGAQKSGTTSLFQYLRHHPQIALPDGKELPYFSHDKVYHRGWQRYMRVLVDIGFHGDPDPSRRWGTVTPHYMAGGVVEPDPGGADDAAYDVQTVPLRIREQLPQVRLIAILRDPVERAVSHHRMAAMKGRERRSFDEAATELLGSEALDHARRIPEDHTGYVVWSEYGRILKGYFDVFPRDQILVVFTDELEREPAQLLSRIEDFIGVSTAFEPENLEARYQVGAVSRGFSWTSPSSWLSPSSPISPQGVQRALRRNPASRALWRAVPERHQLRVRRPYERIAGRVLLSNRRRSANEVSSNAPPSATTLTRLRSHYVSDTELLASLIGTEPPWQESSTAS